MLLNFNVIKFVSILEFINTSQKDFDSLLQINMIEFSLSLNRPVSRSQYLEKNLDCFFLSKIKFL